MSGTRQERDMQLEEFQESIVQFWDSAAKYANLMLRPPEVEVGSTPHEIVFQKDRMRLLHYRREAKQSRGPPILMVYAVINKPYILDLQPDRSVIRTFLKKGFDVYLIDWGAPRNSDKFISTEDYVERYIDECVDWIRETEGIQRVSLFGYCLGGTLATVYAAVHPDKIMNLMIMAAPVDFGEKYGTFDWWTDGRYYSAEKMVKAFGNIPDYLFTWTFKFLDPVQNLHIKYLYLFENAQNDEFVDMFLRMEKWIHDGIPVTGAFYRELIEDWYQGNHIVQNKFKVNGNTVKLKNIRMPVITISGEQDHIVPMASTTALLDFVSSKDKKSVECNCGHIGLSVGSRSHRKVWPEVTNWLAKRCTRRSTKKGRRKSGN